MNEEPLALARAIRSKAKRMRREAGELDRYAARLEDSLADTTHEEDTASGTRSQEELSPAHA